MPRFIDYHDKLPSLPQEAVAQIQSDIHASRGDAHGVVPVNVYIGAGGQGYCVADAPSADAVRKSHEAKGLSTGDIVEVTSLA